MCRKVGDIEANFKTFWLNVLELYTVFVVFFVLFFFNNNNNNIHIQYMSVYLAKCVSEYTF